MTGDDEEVLSGQNKMADKIINHSDIILNDIGHIAWHSPQALYSRLIKNYSRFFKIMFRRKQKQPVKSKKYKQQQSFTRALGEHSKDTREACLEEEVLAVGGNVIEALPSLEQSEVKKKKRKIHQDEEIRKKWVDSDDEDAPEFETVTPNWAGTYDDEKSEDSDEEILKAHSHYNLAPSLTLPSTTLEFKRVTDANKEGPSKASIKSIEFHPKATALLVGGPDQTVRLFAIDGSKNRKITQLYL
ncbi:hypothetical protein Btru_034288 [Bulinus truncatus]|nr:hypothetical protein Btru_034288 [Bulinus truncatus]